MYLVIDLDGNSIKLSLKNGRRIVDQHAWHGEHSLSEKLLPEIDALLKKNGISKKEVSEIKTKISKTSGVTSSRIVETVAKAWNAAGKYKV